jgi:tRNA pseudouridine38-40 synthase
MSAFRITLAYDGTDYVGWQRQAAGTSIQGLVEHALSELDEGEVTVAGAGRTDAGVHALGQVASFSLRRNLDRAVLLRALNARLPPAVRALDAADVADGFHARFAAQAKTYRYRLWNAEVLSPFERTHTWHVPAPRLDIEAMSAAAAMLEGRHDFASFQSTGTDVRSTERVVFSSRLVDAAADDRAPIAPSERRAALIVYEVTGDGFLRHMVRTIAGTLVEVGRGKRSAAWIADVLAARDRSAAGPTAPANGLFLVSVDYGRQL